LIFDGTAKGYHGEWPREINWFANSTQLVAATTVVVATLTSKAAHAGQYDDEADRGFGGHGPAR
jgi:hypothetical protein